MIKEASCLVCLEDAAADDPVYRVCGCTHARVHSKCFAELVAKVPAHRHGCPVCKRAYATAWRPSPSFAVFLAKVALFGTSVHMLLFLTPHLSGEATFVVSMIAMWSFLSGVQQRIVPPSRVLLPAAFQERLAVLTAKARRRPGDVAEEAEPINAAAAEPPASV